MFGRWISNTSLFCNGEKTYPISCNITFKQVNSNRPWGGRESASGKNKGCWKTSFLTRKGKRLQNVLFAVNYICMYLHAHFMLSFLLERPCVWWFPFHVAVVTRNSCPFRSTPGHPRAPLERKDVSLSPHSVWFFPLFFSKQLLISCECQSSF